MWKCTIVWEVPICAESASHRRPICTLQRDGQADTQARIVRIFYILYDDKGAFEPYYSPGPMWERCFCRCGKGRVGAAMAKCSIISKMICVGCFGRFLFFLILGMCTVRPCTRCMVVHQSKYICIKEKDIQTVSAPIGRSIVTVHHDCGECGGLKLAHKLRNSTLPRYFYKFLYFSISKWLLNQNLIIVLYNLN